MAATRRDITTNQTDADRFVQATLALKAEASGLRASDLGIGPGPLAADRDLSTWDLFIVWHVWAMQQISVDGRRNAAHMGPVFLPWHRWYLLVLEAQMRRVLGVGPDDFGLPYWDWAADGSNLTPSRQRTAAAVWSVVGGNGRPGDRRVVDGPFTADQFDVRIEQGPGGQLRATDRGLRRNFGAAATRLPRQTDVDAALDDDTYDRSGWDTSAQLVPQPPRRVGSRRPGDAQPGPRVGGRRHGAGLVAERSDLLPQPLPRRQAVGHLAAGVGRPHLRPDRPVSPGRSAVPSSTGRPRLLDPHDQPTAIAALQDVSSFYVYE